MKISGLSLLLSLTLLGACQADHGSFPTLAHRPIESRSDDIATPPASVAQPADAALIATIGRLRSELDTGARAFSEILPRATAATQAARGAASGSEAWVVAQQQLSALESARGPAVSALAELDSLYLARIDAVAAGTAQGGVDELRGAQQDAARMTQDQQARIDELTARLSR